MTRFLRMRSYAYADGTFDPVSAGTVDSATIRIVNKSPDNSNFGLSQAFRVGDDPSPPTPLAVTGVLSHGEVDFTPSETIVVYFSANGEAAGTICEAETVNKQAEVVGNKPVTFTYKSGAWL